jgi:hypothetical protein
MAFFEELRRMLSNRHSHVRKGPVQLRNAATIVVLRLVNGAKNHYDTFILRCCAALIASLPIAFGSKASAKPR